MGYLVGSLAFGSVFAQSYKFAVARDQDVDWVGAVSFVMGALFLLLAQSGSLATATWPAIWLGVAYGATGVGAQLAFFRALRHGDLAVSWTIVQLSALIPVLASIILWHEHPDIWQALAIGGMVVAILLMGNVELHLVHRPMLWAGWLGLSFLCTGLGGICLKLLETSPARQGETPFLLTAYLVSALLTLPLIRGRRPGRGEVAVGAVRGLAILLANFLMLQAVRVLPGYLVFSVRAAGGVLLNALLAVLVWGERPQKGAYGGIALAVASIAVLSL